jgi:C-terminal processing protease CtpA/Prc
LDLELPCLDEKKEKFNLEIDRTYRLSDTCWRFLTPEIGYLNLGNTTNALLPEIMEKFKDTKGLILDMRSYPSDYLVYSLTKFFLCKPTPFLYTTKGNVGTPGAFTYTKVLKCGGENENPYTGKLILLVNEMTQSAAEYHSLAFLSVPGAKVVGSTTAGADGNVSSFALPGGLSSMITGTGIYYPDGRPTQRLGIVPDYKVLPSIAGVKAGKDEVLEFAMKLMLK